MKVSHISVEQLTRYPPFHTYSPPAPNKTVGQIEGPKYHLTVQASPLKNSAEERAQTKLKEGTTNLAWTPLF